MTPTKTIAVIGAGNMGASLVGGLINKEYSSNNFWISDPDINKLEKLKHEFHINTTSNNNEAIESADIVIFAVKPQHVLEVAKEISALIHKNKPLIISIAAGIRTTSLERVLGDHIAIIRSMPNTASLIGCGVTGVYANSSVTQPQREEAEELLDALGMVIWVPKEDWMDNVTALSGSGLAYFFMVMEALTKAGVETGLSHDVAETLTLHTAYGAALMAVESGVDVTELRKRVTSPGGTTEAALKVMQEHNLTDIYKKALIAAKNRSEEISKLYDAK